MFDTIVAKAIEWDFEIWCASLDLKKAFDRVEFVCVFQALERQGVPQDYVRLLRTLYKTQTGSVEGGKAFPINRGVKQGDVLSPARQAAGGRSFAPPVRARLLRAHFRLKRGAHGTPSPRERGASREIRWPQSFMR